MATSSDFDDELVDGTLTEIASISSHVSLSKEIAMAYEQEGTDGIIRLAESVKSQHKSASDIVQASFAAAGFGGDISSGANGNRGKVCSMINAWIGSCTMDPQYGGQNALRILEEFEKEVERYTNLGDERGERAAAPAISPDIVTFCLIYTALVKSSKFGDPNGVSFDYMEESERIMDRALRLTKKLGGSKRRKAIAAQRTRVGTTTDDVAVSPEVEQELKAILGTHFQVLYESDDLLVVNKPSGVSCYHAKTTPAGKIKSKRKKRQGVDGLASVTADVSLVDALWHCCSGRLSLSTLNPDAFGVVHRLDRGTSGCIVLAKTNDAHARLLTEFFTRTVRKSYTVLTSPSPDLSSVNSEDGSSKPTGVYSKSAELTDDSIYIDYPVDGHPAKSTYRMIERFITNIPTKESFALGNVTTHTGRKHQVRVHCANVLKSPVVGDGLYGLKRENCGVSERSTKKGTKKGRQTVENETSRTLSVIKSVLGELSTTSSRFFLHASSLLIPSFGVNVNAEIPSWWEPVIDDLRRRKSEENSGVDGAC